MAKLTNEIETAARALWDAVQRHGPWDDHDVSAAWLGVSTADPPSLRRLYDVVLKTDRATWAPEVLAAMLRIERALRPAEVEYAYALAAPPEETRHEMGRELRALLLAPESIAPATSSASAAALAGDVTRERFGLSPAPWKVGDPCEVQRGSGRWWLGVVVQITPDVDGEPLVHVRYERDGQPREALERWDSDGLRRHHALRQPAPRHEEPTSAQEAPPPADARAFPATCLLCGAPAYHGAISAECSRGARCGVADPLPMPTRVSQTEYLAPALGVASETIWVAEGAGAWAYHPIREEAIAQWRTALRANARGASILERVAVPPRDA